MTAEQFKQLEALSENTRGLKARLRALQNASVVSAVNYSGTSGNGGSGDSVSRTATLKTDTENEIKRNEAEMQAIVDTVKTENVKMVRDIDRLHSILTEHFVKCRSYEKIYAEFFYAAPACPQQYVKAFEKRLS